MLLFLLNGTGALIDPEPFAALLTSAYAVWHSVLSEGLGLPLLSEELIKEYRVGLVFLLESLMAGGAILTLTQGVTEEKIRASEFTRQPYGLRIIQGGMLFLAATALMQGFWTDLSSDLAVLGSLILLETPAVSAAQQAAVPGVNLKLRPISLRQKAE